LRVEELLAAGIHLLASASGLFLDETEAMVLVLPQIVDSNPCRRVPREREPQDEWAPQVPLAAAIQQPVGLRGWLVEAIFLHEAVDQR
jgi:hypothetical protein